MDVPGDLIKHGDERVDRDEAHTGFDEPAGEQAALAEARQAVAFANLLRLLCEVKCRARPGAGHQPIRRGETAVHQLGAGTALKILHRRIHDLAQLAPAFEARFTDLSRRKQIGHFEIFLRRVRAQHERIVRFPQKAGVLPVRQITAGRSHWFGQDDVRRQLISAAFEKFQRAARMRRVDATSEQTPRLHHLMAGIVHRGGRVIDRADERELVRHFGVQRKHFRNLNGITGRADGFKWTANLARRVGLQIESVELTRRAQIENHDGRLLVIALGDRAHCLQRGILRETQPDGTQRADLQEITAGDPVTGRNRASSGYFQHGIY